MRAKSRNLLCLLCGWLFILTTVAGQKGTAGPGFYPQGYNGDTWTGEVTAADESKREITLTYTKGNKTEDFVAFVPDGSVGWMKDEQGDRVIAVWKLNQKNSNNNQNNGAQPQPAHLNLPDLLGKRIVVYYIHHEKKVNDQKVVQNEVIRIKLLKKN
jgi:hypothetical protein